VSSAFKTRYNIVAQQFKRNVPKKFIIGHWKDMGDILVEEFPNWADTWKNIANAARHCKSVISDDVVESIFQFFDYNIKQTFKFMNPDPNEHSSTVLGVLYMISHGRLPTAESYTLTSALGPTHIAKCWRMASSRKRYLSKDSEMNNNVMSRVYSGLATQASALTSEEGSPGMNAAEGSQIDSPTQL
jgi:hypothetical protein